MLVNYLNVFLMFQQKLHFKHFPPKLKITPNQLKLVIELNAKILEQLMQISKSITLVIHMKLLRILKVL